MSVYKIINEKVVQRDDGAFIPSDNPDYKEYLDWVAAGNIAEQDGVEIVQKERTFATIVVSPENREKAKKLLGKPFFDGNGVEIDRIPAEGLFNDEVVSKETGEVTGYVTSDLFESEQLNTLISSVLQVGISGCYCWFTSDVKGNLDSVGLRIKQINNEPITG